MSEKCKYCKHRIFDDDGQSYGTILPSGEWVCDEELCNVKNDYAALVQAAREAEAELNRLVGGGNYNEVLGRLRDALAAHLPPESS